MEILGQIFIILCIFAVVCALLFGLSTHGDRGLCVSNGYAKMSYMNGSNYCVRFGTNEYGDGVIDRIALVDEYADVQLVEMEIRE